MTKWVTKKLGEIGDIVTGSTPQTNKDIYWNGEYNFYSPADFTEDIYCKNTERTVTELGLSTGRIIPEDSIMVACIASIGKLAINKTKGITNQQINTIIPHLDNDYKFIYYLLLHNVNSIKSKAAQTTIPIINKEDFSSLEFLVPESLAEQRRIASILSSADGAIAASEALIAKYRNIKRGLLATLLQPKEGWKTETLKDCTLKITDGCHNKPKCVERSSLIMLSSQNIQDNKLDLKDVSYLTEEDFERENIRTNVKAGDVLLTIVGTVGRTYLVKETDFRFTLQRSVAVLSPNTQLIESEFLLYYLNHSIPLLENEAHGCAQKGIYLKQLGDMPISYPKDKTEQKRIASILSSIDAKIAAEEKVVEKYKGVKQGLMEELLKSEK